MAFVISTGARGRFIPAVPPVIIISIFGRGMQLIYGAWSSIFILWALLDCSANPLGRKGFIYQLGAVIGELGFKNTQFLMLEASGH